MPLNISNCYSNHSRYFPEPVLLRDHKWGNYWPGSWGCFGANALFGASCGAMVVCPVRAFPFSGVTQVWLSHCAGAVFRPGLLGLSSGLAPGSNSLLPDGTALGVTHGICVPGQFAFGVTTLVFCMRKRCLV